MRLCWLNDALTIKAENPEERHALAIVLKGLREQTTIEPEPRVSEDFPEPEE
jgi:hypothetical protein